MQTMKETTVQIDGMMIIFDGAGVEKQIKRRDGVARVDANFLNGTASVVYDETRVSPGDINTFVADCGYHCRGQVVPAHVCASGKPNTRLTVPSMEHQAHLVQPTATPPTAEPLKEKVKTDTHPLTSPAKAEDHAGHKSGAMSPDKAAMAHDMGHGSGKDIDGMVRDMRNRLIVTLVLTSLIYLYSPIFVKLTGLVLPAPFGLSKDVLMFVLATPAVFYGGWVFYVGVWRALRNSVFNMAVLVSLSVLSGYAFSVGATFFFKAEVFYEALAMLLVFILIGHWLEMRARAGASQAVKALLNLAPPKATVIRNGQPAEVPTSEVLINDIVLIRPGDKIPVDDEVTDGESNVDESMITGHCHRCGIRRCNGDGGCCPDEERSVRRHWDGSSKPCHAPQDAAEFVVGRRVQRHCLSACRRRSLSIHRMAIESRGRGPVDVGLDLDRGRQCAAIEAREYEHLGGGSNQFANCLPSTTTLTRKGTWDHVLLGIG